MDVQGENTASWCPPPVCCDPAPRAGQFLLPPPRLLIQQGNPAAQFRQLTPPGSPPIPAVRGPHHR